METTAAASETSVRRSKRGRPPVAPEEGPSRSSGGDDPEGSPNGMDQGSDGDGSFEDVPENPIPKPKRRRAANTAAATRMLKEGYRLIEVVKFHGKLIPVAVKQLVEQYEKEPRSAMADLLMMLFEACGATYQLHAESLDEIDVDSVVLALVNLARNGEAEDHTASKRKELKNFKENLTLFWDNLVLECESGPLFDKVLFEKCTDYVIALSCTPVRVYRQTASLVGLQLVTSFITLAKTLGSQRETTQRQLNAEKKKRNDSSRVESLNRRLCLTHDRITVAEEMMRKIFTGLFMHRYRDVDPDIRLSSIKALGIWIASYPSLFLQDSYLKYLGWTLNDKSAGVRKTSVLALQSLYEVEGNVPSLGLFTERFSNRMLELADDIDVPVAVSAIRLLKQLLRHQLLSDDELGPLYDLLIDEPPLIRRAIGELVYDHLIAQKTGSTQSGTGGDDDSSEVHLGRMLEILREFPDDPILTSYVIDDVWDDMKAMKDWKCIISVLLDENPSVELTDVDATNLLRLLYASAKRSVGEKIVPATDNRKQYYNKAQKESFDSSRRDLTTAMLKNYPLLLRKYASDKAKVSPLVELTILLKLELYSLKRQEQNFKTVVELIRDAFFKHSEKDALRSCVNALSFCSTESQAELHDFAQNKLKELEDELMLKLKSAMKEVAAGSDEYSLLVNLKRLYEFQRIKHVPLDSLFEDMASILRGLTDLDDEVRMFLLLNMYLYISWCLMSVHNEDSSEESVIALVSKRNILFELLEHFLDLLPEVRKEGRRGSALTARVCIIVAEMWCLFRRSIYASTKLENLGYCPTLPFLQKFWILCEQQLHASDETEEEDENEEYIEETNRDAVMIAAAKLVSTNSVPKDYLGPEIISHFAMHGTSVADIIKHLISVIKKNTNDDIPSLFLEALKRAYYRDSICTAADESLASKSASDCKDLAVRLSVTFLGAARNKHKSHILQIVKDGISFAFVDAPKQLTFLEGAVLPFVSKLPALDALEILKDVQSRSENVNMDEDPSGWRPYQMFVDHLHEKYAKQDGNQDDKEPNVARRRGRPRKASNLQGRKLFEEHQSSDEEDEETISGSDHSDQDEEDGEEDQPLIQTFKSAAKLRSLKVPQQDRSGTSRSAGGND